MKNAIEKAEEGGYDVPAWGLVGWERGTKYQWRSILLDPLFWQALGKAMRWGPICHCGASFRRDSKDPQKDGNWQWKCNGCPRWCENDVYDALLNSNWLPRWHRFIDWLAEGKDPESFFTNLLK